MWSIFVRLPSFFSDIFDEKSFLSSNKQKIGFSFNLLIKIYFLDQPYEVWLVSGNERSVYVSVSDAH